MCVCACGDGLGSNVGMNVNAKFGLGVHLVWMCVLNWV